MKNTDLSRNILLQKCFNVIMEKLVLENQYKIVVLFLVQHMLHQIMAQQFYNDIIL